MTTTNVDRLVEEVLDLAKLTDAYERNGLMGVQELARSALSQARQEGREEEHEKIVAIIDDLPPKLMRNNEDLRGAEMGGWMNCKVAILSALTTEGK